MPSTLKALIKACARNNVRRRRAREAMESMEIVETLNPLDNRLLKAEEQNAREQKLEKNTQGAKNLLKTRLLQIAIIIVMI